MSADKPLPLPAYPAIVAGLHPHQEQAGYTARQMREYAGQSQRLLEALIALEAVAKVESDAEYRAVLDARDVIAEVMGS